LFYSGIFVLDPIAALIFYRQLVQRFIKGFLCKTKVPDLLPHFITKGPDGRVPVSIVAIGLLGS